MKKLVLVFITGFLLITIGFYVVKHNSNPKTAGNTKKAKTTASEYLAASVAQRTGDIKGAIIAYENALVLDPENPEIIKKLYGLYLFTGDYDKAMMHAKRQIEIDKASKVKVEDEDAIAYLLVALDNFRNKKADANYVLLGPITDPKIPNKNHIDGAVIPMVLAWSYVVEENYTQAFKVIDGITTQYMLSVFSYNRALINDLANNKKVQIDGKNYTLQEKAQKFLSQVFAEIGQYSLQAGNIEEAVVYIRLARYLDMDSIKLKRLLANIFEAMGNFQEAINIYHEVPESSEGYGDVLTGMALDYHSMQQNDKALEILEKLKNVEGFEYNALFAIGSIKLADNQFQEAVKYFEQAKQKIAEPKAENWNLFFNTGVAYDRLNEWDKAETNLKKSVELNPQNPEALNYLAYSWLVRNKNIKQAREMLEAAVIRSGGAPHILDSYGWALFKLGYYKEAVPFLEQAVNGMSYSAVINDHLGNVYWKAGRKLEAKYQWQKALDVFDKDQDITPEVTKEELQKKIDSGFIE